MIRVTHVLPNFGPAGAETMAANLMRTLDREQFEVSAISFFARSGTDLEETLAQDEIPVWYLDKRPGLDLRMFMRVGRALERIRPHVLHTHRYVLRYTLPYMLSGRIPSMIHTQHTLVENKEEADWHLRLSHRIAFRRGVVPVAIAQEVAAGLRRCYKVDGFPLIPNGIPVDTLRHPSIDREEWRSTEGFATTDVLFVCVAGLREVKNPTLLVESFAQGPASDPRAHLLFVGTGPLKPKLESQVDALGLQDKIHLLGVRSDIPEILNAADAFVLSSNMEGNPLSVMEAMAAGKPLVCTAVGGVPELVEDGMFGLLVPPWDAVALAKGMTYMLENPEARSFMGRASAKRAIERFDLKGMTEAYENLYRTTLGKAYPLHKDG